VAACKRSLARVSRAMVMRPGRSGVVPGMPAVRRRRSVRRARRVVWWVED